VVESVVLPLIFVTVALLGGLRLTTEGQLLFLPPTLFSLLLSALLVGTLVQAGLVKPGALVFERRFFDGLSGAVLMATLFAASAQILNGLVPERGLLALLFNIFLAVILTNTIATAPEGPR